MKNIKNISHFIFFISLLLSCSTKEITNRLNGIQVSHHESDATDGEEFFKKLKKYEHLFKRLVFSPEWQEKLQIKTGGEFIEKYLTKVKYSKYNCRSDQVACAYPDKKEWVFTNKNILKIHPIEIWTTLFHEASHHIWGYDHSKLNGEDCDVSNYSPYGLELEMLKKIEGEGDVATRLKAKELVIKLSKRLCVNRK